MNNSSHHFLLYKFDDGAADGFMEGLRPVGTQASDDVTSLVAAWQYNDNIELPAGTAYKWAANTVLDFNYHIVNYSTDSVLKAELYLNIETQASGTAEKEMFSDLVLYPPFAFYLPADGQDHEFTNAYYQNGSNYILNVWMLSSHTHKYGKDYDIYLRNSDGSQGEQVYEGFYNTDYSFNQGYYDWEHPATRYFEPFIDVPLKDGFIHTAVYNNYGDDPVYFNVTTEDEMMLFFVQYTLDVDASVSEEELSQISIFPNPMNQDGQLIISSDQDRVVELNVVDMMGRTVFQELNHTINQGQHALNINDLSSGTYLVQLKDNQAASTFKLVVK